MDIRNARIEPVIEHGGTCCSYFLVGKESMRQETQGSYLEFICEFEIAPGSRLKPHYHDSHEFYYVLSGTGTMTIERETRPVQPGDLIHIPRNAVHSIAPNGLEPIRSLAFAASFMPPGGSGTEATKAPLPEKS